MIRRKIESIVKAVPLLLIISWLLITVMFVCNRYHWRCLVGSVGASVGVYIIFMIGVYTLLISFCPTAEERAYIELGAHLVD